MISSPFLLIPGWAARASVWSSLELDGSRFCPDFREVLKPADFRSAVRQVLPKSPAIVIGWSLGAMLAIELAAAVPAAVRALVIFSGTLRFVDESRERGWPRQVLGQLRRRIARTPGPALAAFRRQLFAPAETEAAEVYLREFPPEDFGDFSLPALLAGLDYLADTDLRETAATVACPALWVHGSADLVCPAAALDLLPPQFDRYIIADAGHVPFRTQPASVRQRLTTFLTSL